MMADRRRWSPESSARRKRDHKPSRYDKQPQYDEPDRMRSGAASPSSSSTSSSYLDISHTYPYKTGLSSFFTAPSERRRLRKRRSNRSLGGHSSSSSLNLDLAYGTGYIRRPKRREVRSRKGKEIDREKNRDARRERDSNHQPTDAEILAVGAGLAKLARDQNKHDLKSKNGKRAELVAVKEAAGHREYESGRGLGPSKISHGSDTVDEDGWESASDDGSISSVDSRLAFGDDSGGWFGWGRPRPPPQSRKTSVVDPRFFGPANSLHGIVTEAVGFDDVTWDPSADHGKDNPFPIPRLETPPNGSRTSLQRVYPVATSDPSRFEAARSSVVSGSEPYVSSKPGELPLQQPQPYSPVSKNVFEPRYSAASESGASKKSSSSRQSKSLAEAALAGVAVATAGAVIASERRDDRLKRRDGDRKDPRDDRRRENRQSPDREERREKRREKERRRDSDGPSSEKRRERRYDDPRYDDREDRRENRREDRPETRYDDSYYGGQSSSTRVPVDPFQYQVADDAFETPKSESPILRKIENRTPTVVTVEREPDFSRFMSSSSKVEPRDPSDQDDKEQSHRGRDPGEKELNDPERASEETGRSTAAVAAIGAAVAAASAERARKAIERRRDRGDDYDRREKYSAKEPEPKAKPARDPVQEEADRAYREIIMARKIASQVIRSRTPSPNRSVVEKYEEEDEPEEIIRVVTPSSAVEEEQKEKRKGPYDAPNADFKLDLVLEDPRHLRHGSLPRIDFDTEGSSLKLDPDASKPRPFLNLVRPTPTPSPAPEKQMAESESKEASSSAEREVPTSTTSNVVESKDVTPSSASSATSKGVTWGENETKHYHVESPHEHRDEFVSSSEVREVVKEVEQPKPTRPTTKRSGWGAVVAGITGAGIGAVAATASDASKSSKSKSGDDKRDEKPVVDEPRGTRSESSTAEPTQVPGAFNDDLDFTATVAAGLQDTGFDPNIVINDPSFRRRESPPGSNEPRRDDRGDSTRDGETYGSRDLVEEPETYFEPAKLSKKEQRKRDKAAQRQESQSEEVAEVDQPIVADELVEEPDSYSSSSRKKSKKSKRDSANLDDAEEAPRQSRRISIPVDAFEDLRKGEDEWEESKQSKSKKKSKRDSETYDSPTRSAPSEVASEFDTPSGKKSKKSKRKSGSYDTDPDPAEISLPPSEPSEVSRDGAESESRRSRRSSRRDDDDRGESRSVASPEEESRKSKKKSRSSTKDDFDDTRSVASAPVEDAEYSKSRKKEKRSSGGFFGMFGSKSDVGKEEHSPKALRDDFEEDTRKKSKKSKRQSLQDEPSAVADSFDDQPRSSANGHTRSNGSRDGVDDDDYTPRTDGESKTSQSKSESASAENDSFLDNAGILGAGAGLAGVAIALAAQHHQQSKADLEKSSTAIESTHSDRSLPSQRYDTIVDPEIVQRQFRPSIDPQYGDLLPLPPSGPTSPNLESFDELPGLPDSRPDTPEAERFPRERGMSSARKSLQDAPVKSPSQSAVPLKFIMGNRSVPASPGLARSSPLQSPITQQESLASPRNRPRPTSWDSTKEYKPLYLVETNRRNSIVQHNKPEEPLPELPPSQSTSRSGSEMDFHDAVSDLGPDESSDELEHSAHPLSIDTELPSTEARSELLDSQQSTPKAGMQPQDIESTRRIEQESESHALPSLPPSSSLLLSSGDDAAPLEREKTGAESAAAAAAAVASSIGYFASSPSHRLTNQAWLDKLTSSHPAQPSPVEPMTKDRSSYLLQSSPLSKKAEDDETFDSNLDSSTSRQLFSNPENDSLQSIEEGESEAIPEIIDAYSAARNEDLPEVLQDQPADDVSRSVAEENTQETAPETELDLAATSNIDAEPADEFFMASTKKSKKDKKRAKHLSRSVTFDDIPVPESSQETPKDDFPVGDADPVEEPSSGKSKKSKKKDKKAKSASLDWEPQSEESAPQSSPDPLPEASQEPIDDSSAADEFATVKTKGKNKKDKKKSRLSVSWEDTPEESATTSSVDPEQTQETSREVVEAAAESGDSKPATEFFDDNAQSGVSQDMLKGLGIWGASSIIEKKTEDSTSAAQDIEDPAAAEALSRDAPAEENIIAATAVPDTEELEKVDKDTDLPPTSTAQEPDAGDEFFMTSSKKSKKKGKKSRAEKLDEESSLETAASTDRSTSRVDAADVSRPANVMEDFFEQVSRSGSKKGKKKSKKSKAWDEEVESQEDGAKELRVENVETTEAAAVNDDPAPPKATYFPSASHLHSPKKSSESESGGYFPSATAVLPIAAAGAALAGSSLLEKSKDQDTSDTIKPQDLASKSVEADDNRLPQPEVDSNPTAPDGLKAGYDNEQLNLARQLQEEFGSKKSKRDKKKRQSLPATSDREVSRSRAIEDDSDIQPRARSLSVEPSPRAGATEGTSAQDKPKALYGEDQLELARQLKAEFEAGNKKSKKDKNKRPGISRSATFDEEQLDSAAEPSPSVPTEGVTEPADLEDSAKGDGFAAGYQEDQLSLARQLQAEFGSGSKKSKKDKKGKKRESASQTPTLESENTSDYFGDAAQASGSDFLRNDDHVESPESSTRDGLAVGYSAEQLELARQLKEEFGSKSSKKDKKDKKDKKRKSLLRNSSEDREESQPPPDADPETSNLEVAEATSIEPAAADPDDEFTFTTKKKGKKGKKRDSLVPKSDIKDDEFPPVEDAPEQEPEPVPVDIAEPAIPANPEDEFAPVSKKGKKGKKGKKQDLAFEPDDKEPAPEPISNDKTAELDVDPPAQTETDEPAAEDLADEFAFVSKKSKKGKKGKKQDATFESDDKEPALEPLSTDRDVEPDVTPLPEANEPVADDDFTSVSKKSKKGKKGKKRADTWEEEEAAPQEGDVQPESGVAGEQNPEPAVDDSAPTEKELTATETNKDESLETTRELPEERSEELSFEDQVRALHDASALQPAEPQTGVGEDPSQAPPEEFSFTTKKSKKGKKKQQQSPPSDEPAESSVDPVEVQSEQAGKTVADSQPPETGSASRDVETAFNSTEPIGEPDNTFEDFGFSTTKSKKDKKKRKSLLTATLDEELEPSLSNPTTVPAESSESQPPSLDDTTQAEPATSEAAPAESLEDSTAKDLPNESVQGPVEEPTDEWSGFSAKKSKKDKKKRKSGVSTPAEETPSAIEEDKPTVTEAVEEPVSEPTVVDDNTSAALSSEKEPPSEQADEWGSFSTKKSKKDKKKRKSGLSTPAEDVPVSTEEEPRGNLKEPEFAPTSVDETPASIPEPVEEATDEWSSFSTKKSKKDKKKRKSGLSTPIEETPVSAEEDKPRELEGLEEPVPAPALVDDSTAAAPVSPNDPVPEPAGDTNDEWSNFSTKKSKKDKKKRKSGLSTPAEETTSLVEEQKPLTAEESAEPQPVPLPADDDIPAPKAIEDDVPKEEELVDEPPAEEFEVTTKKSKKDKKKSKKSSFSTAFDDVLPTENTAGASLETQPEQLQTVSAEVEHGLPNSQEDNAVFRELSEQPVEDDFGFATKKSKKSKKAKRESQNELAASIDPSESNFENQSPSIPEQSGDNVPSIQEDSQAREAPMLEPMPELTPTEAQGRTMDQAETKSEHSDLASNSNEWMLKHDKRKRQATVDAAINNDLSTPQPISWADEVEEAEIERQLPIIDDIAKDESLSHIATTTHVDDFSRPTKKGKKGKKGKKIDLAEFTSTNDSSREPAESSSVKEEPMQENSKMPGVLAAAGTILAGAALLGKFDKAKAKNDEELVDSRDFQQPRESFEPVPEPASEPVTPLNTKRYSHPGSSTLPAVEEESPDPIAPRPQYVQDIDDANRDSAFVTESPVPRQRGFNDDLEHNRDSGVHLRESSPYDKARATAATDEALSRMPWPAVDEESETVDLHRSRRRKAEVYEKPHHDTEEISSKERSLDDDKDTSSSQRRRHEEDDSTVHHLLGHNHRLSPAQLHKEEPPSKHIRLESPKHDDDISVGHRDVHADSRDDLPSQRAHTPKFGGLHRSPAVHMPSKLKEESTVRQRVQRIESPDSTRSQRPPEEKYGDLSTARRSKAEKPSSAHSSPTASGLGITGAGLGFAASRIASQEHRGVHNQSPGTSPRSLSNINRLRSPDPRTPVRPDSRGSNPSSVTPPLRRSDRKSGDLRSLSQRSKTDLAKDAELAGLTSPSTTSVNTATANPTANEGRVRAKEMADVYDGFGEGRMGSPRSPTRPHSMRRRQSMQVLDLESRLEQLAAENRQLSEARAQAEQALQATQHSSATLVERDAEIESLKRTLDWLQNEVTRLTEVNDGLNSANITLGNQHNERYSMLESQHAQTSRELEDVRESHSNLMAGAGSMEDKDREIAQLRADLEAAKDRIREMQVEILASKADDSHFLVVRDEDYFDSACQKLCQHVQQWVLRFSKFSDMRACRLTSEINNDKTIDRLDNAILDGSDVDSYLSDRVKRRDVFMSMTMTMVWEFVFTRYLFGMDREQRQKLKSLEKLLSEVGPASAVHQWRATTLTLLAKREAFVQQREQDTLAVVHAVMETLSEILPPPSHLEQQIQDQLVRVIKAAVDLSIEMRTQRAEYMMLPPLQPEYDANGDLASKVNFNAALMNERSGDTVSNEELEESGAVVKIVLFPLVVKKGDDSGEGDEEIVVCPAQVLVAKPKRSVRVFSPESAANQSRVSMQSALPADQQWERVDM